MSPGPPHPAPSQPFLRKIFEGINGLEFQPSGDITAMISEEAEKVSGGERVGGGGSGDITAMISEEAERVSGGKTKCMGGRWLDCAG